MQVHPNIIVVILLCMTYDDIYLVRDSCIFYLKSKRWFESAFPLLVRNGGHFFIQVNGSAGSKRPNTYHEQSKK
jgi:hypothetical protein